MNYDVFGLDLGQITSALFGSFLFLLTVAFTFGLMRYMIFGATERPKEKGD
jgi:accessory gene regulator protein AgrB